MENKVYVIKSYFSDGGETSFDMVEGIYTDPITAEELSRKITEGYLFDKNDPEPKWGTEIWLEWFNRHEIAVDFKKCYVQEVILNTRLYPI